MTHRIEAGWPEPLGATPMAGGVNFAVHSGTATAIDLCLFAPGSEAETRLRLPGRTGEVFHGLVPGLGAGQRYGLRAHGPFDPAAGLRFNPAKLLLDPQALAIDRPFRLHPALFGHDAAQPEADLSLNLTDSAPFMPKAVVQPAAAPLPVRQPPDWQRLVIYELHVRGFTMLHPEVPAEQRGTFAGLAHPAVIAHLAGLGVTAVELLPVAAWVDERHLPPLGLSNYWGYNPVAWCAPDPRLAPGGWPEVRAAVATLQAAGIAVILDVVLNHSGEGDELGPTLSLRGLDNAGYYRLRPQEPRRYIDDAGTGNILACDRPAVVRLAMDALRAWALRAGVDGFRFDLAATLGRRAEGFDPAAPLLTAIAQDPVLRGRVLIAEPWDIGPGGHQTGRFPPAFAEWNDRYRDTTRRFWRGDAGQAATMATALAGSADLFAGKTKPSRGVNYITAHDGFTLADLVSYVHKRNHANGEDNRDGSNDSLSWHNGVEGPTQDAAVLAARRRDQRNLLATLLFSRGTPMLAMGSEGGHSQQGNNNAYCQDNALSWLDWQALDGALAAFTARVATLRQRWAPLHADRFLTGMAETGALPDVEWLDEQGAGLAGEAWHHGDRRLVVACLAAPGADGALQRVLLALNAGQGAHALTLPAARDGHVWQRLLDTADEDGGAVAVLDADAVTLPPRAVLLLGEVVAEPQRPLRAATPEALASLAAAAGLAPAWWEVNGTHHHITPETQRALLAAMGLPAASAMQVRESLAQLADEQRRPLPFAHHGWSEGGGPALLAGAANARHLLLELEDGSRRALPLAALAPQARTHRHADGRESTATALHLPPLPPGRHRLMLDGDEQSACHLTIAPSRCHLPPALAEGGRRSGVAAHLYALRRREGADQGIGDFTTLAAMGEAAGRHGAALLGLNPLHALFGQDRERASPYQPSDRRMLDAMMIDVAADVLAESTGARAALAEAEPALAALRQRRAIDYPAVWAIKQRVLRAAHGDLAGELRDGALAPSFRAFVAGGGSALTAFATFEAIAEAHADKRFPYWPAGLRRLDAADVPAFAREQAEQVHFHLFLQWLADRQLGQAAARAGGAGLSLGFYRDLAVGSAPDGAEIWSQPGLSLPGVSVGAPPDPFSAQGQVWGLPPINPQAMRRQGFAGLAALLAANMRHAGALRIDHVMALARLFVVPEGAPGSAGTYLAMPLEAMLAEVCLASHRHRCLVVGEDLGTVPEGFRERLAAADVLSYRVLFFEREGRHVAEGVGAEGFRPLGQYPAKAVACVSTHDLPTFRGWRQGADIAEAATLGLLPEAAVPHRLAERRAEEAALGAMLVGEGLAPATDDDTALAAAVHAAVARTPAMLAMAQADDLAGETTAVNLPGTDRERPNWRRRLEMPVEDLFSREPGRSILAALRREE